MIRRGLWITCSIVANFVQLCCTAAERLQLEKQQIGIRMCQRFCQQMSGCHALTYTYRNLTCQISDVYNPVLAREHGINIFSVSQTNSLNATGNRKCQLGNILMQSQARLFQCVKYRRRQKDQVRKVSAKRVRDYLKMTSDTHAVCQKLYQLCESGKKIEAKDQLIKLCAKSGRAGRSSCPLLYVYVLRRGCDLSQVNPLKDTILHRASGAGLLHVVKCVLSKGTTSLERRNSYGMTPIMSAAMNAETKVFRLLLNVGSDISITDDSGYSLLHTACQSGSVNIVKDILMEGSVRIQSRSELGLTPMMTAVKFGRKAIFKLLLQKGSNLSEVTDSGSNLLHIASSQRNSNLLKYILDSNIADIDSEDYTGRTSLMMAALRGRRYAFHCLLRPNASLHVVDSDGNNLLHMACKGGDVEIVKTLVKRMNKDAMKKKNKEGKTPLELVNANRHGELIPILKQM